VFRLALTTLKMRVRERDWLIRRGNGENDETEYAGVLNKFVAIAGMESW